MTDYILALVAFFLLVLIAIALKCVRELIVIRRRTFEVARRTGLLVDRVYGMGDARSFAKIDEASGP